MPGTWRATTSDLLRVPDFRAGRGRKTGPSAPIASRRGCNRFVRFGQDFCKASGVCYGQYDSRESLNPLRGIARDGGTREATEFWWEWSPEEQPFLAADRPWERADGGMGGDFDYRRQVAERSGVYHWPLGEVSEAGLHEAFARLATEPPSATPNSA